ncbi:hypothetical protein [Candidatus Enterovibrio escicola]|uniref:10 kDa chaperonin n=1 Tax=Candidatus Enterovibrio escicola TaxID=1927127 RepID=A0A2A5T353_9GAMM|nr:hypothetical protein [Candidatus Enterovibrio escacola]PCS22603.1 hypothetical protein BTN49_1829 [Candidatus Enterovibrio escacola]
MHDYIAIQRKAEEQEQKGFFIPSSPSSKATVVAVGLKVREIVVGDVIQFNRYAGYVIKGDGVDVTLIHEGDVLFIEIEREAPSF